MADLNVAQHLLSGGEALVKILAQFSPVPGLAPAVDILCALLIICQNVQANKEETKQLGERCYRLSVTILRSCKSRTSDATYVDKLAGDLTRTLDRIMDRVTEWIDTKLWDAIMNFHAHQQRIKQSHKEIDDLLEQLHLSAELIMVGMQVDEKAAREADSKLLQQQMEDIKRTAHEIPARVIGPLMEFIQNEIHKKTVGSGSRMRLEATVNFIHQETGAVLPPRPIEDGVELGDVSTMTDEGNNYSLRKGFFQNEVVSVRRMNGISGTVEQKQMRFHREIDVWRKIWTVDKGKHTLRILGYTIFSKAYGFPEPAIICPWNENRHALRYVTAHPFVDHTKIILNIARGIRVLHGLVSPPLIHGDIRAENVEINSKGEPLLTGFGWTKFANELGGAKYTSAVNGDQRPRFVGPEQQVDTDLSLKGDIYSFAMTMIQIFTHDKPYPEEHMMAKLSTQVMAGLRPSRPTDPAVVERGLNDSIWKLMQQCWDAKPENRPDIHIVLQKLKHAWPHLRN